MANHLSFPEQLKRERELRGWSQADLASKLGCDTKTVGRWEREGKLPRPEYRQGLCELFGKDAEELGLIQTRRDNRQKAPSYALREQAFSPINEPDTLSTSSPPQFATVLSSRQEDAELSTQRERLREDWGEAPRLENFYGRTLELAAVKQWIGEYHCRIVAVLGMGGVGKTVFTSTLTEQVKDAFQYVFWRSLHNAPPLEHVLQECIQFVSDQRRVKLPKEIDDQILLLIEYLRSHRCLLVLDNLESLFQPGLRVGAYQEDYEGYGRLIQLVGETRHQSCLVLTSREKPREVVHMEGKAFPVRSLYLPGIGQTEGQELLQERGLFGSDEHWAALIDLYAGNPLALQLIAESIRGVFGADIARFLEEEQVTFGDIHDLIDQQLHRLSLREREILYWLAIEREAVSLEDIHKDLVRPTTKGELLEALDSLRRRSMIEGRSLAYFTLQPVIMEYVTTSLVKRAYKEFGMEAIGVWTNYAFIKARTKDYVRESQRRLILAPIAERLLDLLGKVGIEQKLKSILSTQRQVHSQQRNYLAGNALNLLIHLQCDLRSFDFSQLVIRQAYLQQAVLPDVNFTHAQFVESIFSGTFGNILSVAFSPNGDVLAAGTATGEIWVYQTRRGMPLLTCQGHTDAVWSLAFSSDDSVLASSSDDQTIRLWNVDTGQCLQTLQEHRHGVRSVAFSPDGTMLASGGDDQCLRLWEVSTGHCLEAMQGHTNRVWSVNFSPDGRSIGSSCEDLTIRVWDVNTALCLKTLRNPAHGVRFVSFSPDGSILASCGEDQTVRLWDVSTSYCVKILQGHTNWVRYLALASAHMSA